MQEVAIPTPDGDARSYVFKPETGAGPWPAVIFFMDAPAIRPELFHMSQRLADHGYYVLLPDMFWRAGPYEPINIAEVFKDEAARRERFGKFMASTDPERSTRDTEAFLDWLAKQPDVKGTKVGVTGYCMGAGLALRAAGNFPDRVVAAAGFHGGRLATDAPDSPHLLAPQITARVYIAGADEDAGFPPEQADRLREALTAAGVENEITIYKGARHGYACRDLPVYNEEAAERHWTELFKLLDGTLKVAA
ncbi:MAG TPA: dienelactone hydrolase family protein [Caulobacteraceae bacterium]|jgi:carboxymethylenebutenolidase|nr:dienelactone hydrolase family protein [Caulobacteraceae bacterium]